MCAKRICPRQPIPLPPVAYPRPAANPLTVNEDPVSAFHNLLFPRRCVVCEHELSFDSNLLVCSSCQVKLSRGCARACRRCGGTKTDAIDDASGCIKCRNVTFQFEAAVSLGEYVGELRRVVIQMKQPGQESLSLQMGRWLGSQLREFVAERHIDIVVAMPCYWTRHFSRGANVSALLCEGFCKEVSIRPFTRLLKQVRPTRKQGTLSRTQRLNNVKNAFVVRPGFSIDDITVLLVDDVMTSGATINEASRVLNKAGAKSVFAAVVARGVGTF